VEDLRQYALRAVGWNDCRLERSQIPTIDDLHAFPVNEDDPYVTTNGDMVQAEALYRSGDFGRAQAIAESLLKREPGNVVALNFIEEIAFSTGVFASAISCFRGGVAAKPADATLFYKLGCLLEADGDLQGALDAYRVALRLNPAFAKAHNNVGATLQKTGNLGEALRSFATALQLDQDLWQAHYNIGNLHKAEGRLGDAVVPFQQAMRLRRAPGATASPNSGAMFEGTSGTKLAHDIEQLTYLLDRGLISVTHAPAVAALKRALHELTPQFESTPAPAFPKAMQAAAAPYYNRLLYLYDAPMLSGPAVNPHLDRKRIEDDYFRSGPGVTYVDDFLTPEALANLRRFCLESTVWFEYLYTGGYIGASLEEGFICPLLAQIAAELPRALPRIFGDHALTHLWGYKYDSARTGIGEHADFAAVNVNFWLTPDDSNLDPDSGGLVVWDKEAPPDWDFDEFNQDPGRIRTFLQSSGARPVTVPHRQNRVVIFNSDLFHKTDSYRFRTGYLNRRINVTFLYGYRQRSDDPLAGLNTLEGVRDGSSPH